MWYPVQAMVGEHYPCVDSLLPTSSRCHQFPLSPIIPPHTQIPPVTPLFPPHTKVGRRGSRHARYINTCTVSCKRAQLAVLYGTDFRLSPVHAMPCASYCRNQGEGGVSIY